uniref:Uncharacterized protein n=1 Tax=Anguilla anguilla TaxID=7936 RepID=A0A0E9TNJ0_ANGAN
MDRSSHLDAQFISPQIDPAVPSEERSASP